MQYALNDALFIFSSNTVFNSKLIIISDYILVATTCILCGRNPLVVIITTPPIITPSFFNIGIALLTALTLTDKSPTVIVADTLIN